MEQGKLKRNLGLFSATMVVIGLVLGTGIFFKPQALFTATGAPGLGIIACVLAGAITMCGALASTEIANMIPKTGGETIWIEEIYGPLGGYLKGWFDTVLFYPGSIAAFAIVFGTQVASLLGLKSTTVPLIGIAAVVFLAFVNSMGNKAGALVQNLCTVAKVIPIVLIIVIGFFKGGTNFVRLTPMTDPAHPVASSLGIALLACMFSFDGWIGVTNITGELKNPKKDIARSIIGGLTIYTIIFVLAMVAYLLAIPAAQLSQSATPAADVAMVLFGPVGGTLITVGILISAFGVINGNILVAMRIPYAMAKENKLPGSKYFAWVNPKTNVPILTAVFEAVLVIIYILSGTFNKLTDIVTFTNWIFYVMVFFAVILMRKKAPDRDRPFKCPLYPGVPLFAIIGGVFMLISVAISQPQNAMIGIGLTAIGIPLYFSRRNKFSKDGSKCIADENPIEEETKKSV